MSMPRRSRLTPLRRSGCTTCKCRHKKCDEQKPRCGNCHRLGLECKQPELFRVSKPPRYDIDRLSYFNFSLGADSPEVSAPRDFLENQDLLDNNDEDDNDVVDVVGTTPTSMPSMSCISFSPSPGVPLTWAQPQPSSTEHYLLHHYTFNMSRVLINVDGPSNPLRSVLLPRAVISPTLMNALYATSALHVFVGNRDPEFRTLALAYYNRAASALHHLIANLGPRTERADFEILLLTAVYLCLYEIISGGSNWRFHLQGIQKLFDTSFFQENIAKMAPETVAYVQSFIVYHTHIAGLTRLEKPSSPTTIDPEQESEIAKGSLNTKIDPYMGVSASLISLLHVAAETTMVDLAKPSNLGLMMKIVIKLYHRLQSRDVKTSVSLGLSEELTKETIDCLDHIADAYRNALVAYLHIILDAIEANTAADELILQCLGMRSLLASTKEEAISACLRDMSCVPDEMSCAVGLVPLLFIVAGETRNRTEFEIASQRLQAILKTACLGNIAPALELLQKTQQPNSGDWRQILKGFGWDLIVT